MRSDIFNVVSFALPLIVGFFTVGYSSEIFGIQKFGALTLSWTIVSIIPYLDLGMSKALTIGSVELKNTKTNFNLFVTTVLICTALLGLIYAFLFFLLAINLDNRFDLISQKEYLYSVIELACCIPVVLIANAYRGFLDGIKKYSISSFNRILSGLTVFLSPLLYTSQTAVVDGPIFYILLSRIIVVIIYYIYGINKLNYDLRLNRYVISYIKRILFRGLMLTISGLSSLIIINVDKFILAFGRYAYQVAYYNIPFEFVTKLFVIPAVINIKLFPKLLEITDDGYVSSVLSSSVNRLTTFVILPVVLLILFPYEILYFVFDRQFANESSDVTRILVAGVFLNCYGQIFHNLIVVVRNEQTLASLNFVELLIFAPLIYWGVDLYGMVFAAITYNIRIVLNLFFIILILNYNKKIFVYAKKVFSIAIIFLVILLSISFFPYCYKIVLFIFMLISCIIYRNKIKSYFVKIEH